MARLPVAKSHLRTNTFVFGTRPLNIMASDNLGKKRFFERRSSHNSIAKLANTQSFAQINGQNGADGQHGRTSFPSAPQTWAGGMTLRISAM